MFITTYLMYYARVILPNIVHTGNIHFLAIFYKLAANEHGFIKY